MDSPAGGGSHRTPPPPPPPLRKAPRLLVVDGDNMYVEVLEKLLRQCRYEVATCSHPSVAMKMLRERKGDFEMVLTDAFMPDMAGFELMERVHGEMDLPVVIMMSVDGNKGVVARAAIDKKACHYLIKPVSMEALKNIRQHIVKRRGKELETSPNGESSSSSPAASSGGISEKDGNKNIGGAKRERDDQEKNDKQKCEQEVPSASTSKKQRVVWTPELHGQFVAAVKKLGQENAVPKRILELMNVPGLTRENVASHLQKYRLSLRRGGSHEQRRVQESSTIYPKLIPPSQPFIISNPSQQLHLIRSNGLVVPRSDHVRCNNIVVTDHDNLRARSSTMQHMILNEQIRPSTPYVHGNDQSYGKQVYLSPQQAVPRMHLSNVYMANNIDLLRNNANMNRQVLIGGHMNHCASPYAAGNENFVNDMQNFPRSESVGVHHHHYPSNISHVEASKFMNMNRAYLGPDHVHAKSDELRKSCTVRQEIYSIRTQVEHEYVNAEQFGSTSFDMSDENIADDSYHEFLCNLPEIDHISGSSSSEISLDPNQCDLHPTMPNVLQNSPPNILQIPMSTVLQS